MSGRIIGAPPEKRGATFADIAKTQVFDAKDPSERASDDIVRWVESRGRARQLNALSADWVKFPASWPVIPLTLTPVEPEPDPAVKTYGELVRGTHWRRLGSGLVWQRLDDRLSSVRVDTGHVEPAPVALPVRVLSPLEVAAHFAELAGASVVVHEEPGRFVTLDGGKPGFTLLGARDMWARLEHIVRQGAALLAQRDASPASEPVEEPIWEHAREAAAEVETWSDAKRAAADQALVTPTERKVTLTEGVTVDASGLEPGERVRVFAEVVSVEDRSKPAPGWAVDDTSTPSFDYADPSGFHVGTTYSEAEAIERTWAKHDAQQAGNGGESDG